MLCNASFSPTHFFSVTKTEKEETPKTLISSTISPFITPEHQTTAEFKPKTKAFDKKNNPNFKTQNKRKKNCQKRKNKMEERKQQRPASRSMNAPRKTAPFPSESGVGEQKAKARTHGLHIWNDMRLCFWP